MQIVIRDDDTHKIYTKYSLPSLDVVDHFFGEDGPETLTVYVKTNNTMPTQEEFNKAASR